MMNLFLNSAPIILLLIIVSCNRQVTTSESPELTINAPANHISNDSEPHRYGAWYCPDNFGFAPVDIQRLDEVPAIADRLPSQEELRDKKSLISVDRSKYPDARALKMKLPRVAQIYSDRIGMDELIIVIQAIIIDRDTIVGYRFPNGGNGSARLSEVSFLSEAELTGLGSQPFFYQSSVLKASKEEIWKSITLSDYFGQLGEKFNEKDFFSSDWTADAEVYLKLDADEERARGYVGTVFGNAYLQIDYNKNGFHYSEKLLMIENQEDGTTELFFASGPYPLHFEREMSKWLSWLETVKKRSEAD